jgi:hypothetical protein
MTTCTFRLTFETIFSLGARCASLRSCYHSHQCTLTPLAAAGECSCIVRTLLLLCALRARAPARLSALAVRRPCCAAPAAMEVRQCIIIVAFASLFQVALGFSAAALLARSAAASVRALADSL